MKGPSLAIIGLVFLAPLAGAQSSFEDEINNELDHMYASQQQSSSSSTRGQVNGRVVGNDQVVDVGEGQRYRKAESGQPIYILNQATPSSNSQVQSSQSSVQRQQETVIEATPLTDSRAERLRRQRQGVETQTEMKIVEELERSRMEDEQRRADALFGNRLSNQQQNQQSQSNVVVVPEPRREDVRYVEVEPRRAESDIQGEMHAAVADLQTQNDAIYNEQVYVSGLLGFGDYPDAINVRSNLSLGVSIGTRFRDRMMLEGNFVYGNYDVEHVENGSVGFYPEITSMDQYTMGGTFKYQVLGGMLRPFVGATLAYQYRSFSKTQYYFVPTDATSHGTDIGAVFGADLEISPDFSIGLDYRYLWNVYTRSDYQGAQGSFVNPAQQSGTPIEQMNQSLLSVVGRVTF